jgi:hypothetical protein
MFLASCGNDPKVAIIGKWSEPQGMSYEFFPDGTVRSAISVGKFSFPDQTHIKMEFGGLEAFGGPQLWGYSIKGDSLSLTWGDTKTFELHRAK